MPMMSSAQGRSVGAGVAALVGLGSVLVLPSAAVAAPSLQLDRVSGASRYQTAAQISSDYFPDGSASTVVIAGGTSTVDALASAFVAGSNHAPVLLTERDTLPNEAAAELERLGAEHVVLAGGESVIGPEVEDLLAENYEVTRAGGDDRYETAALLAGTVADSDPEVVFVASGAVDAAAVSPVSAANGWPVLLTPSDSVVAATEEALAAYPNADVVVVGGLAAVSENVAAELGATSRLYGADRFETAVNIADFARDEAGFSSTGFGLALGRNGDNGDDLADALTAGPALATEGAPLLLSETPAALGSVTTSYLALNTATFTGNGTLFGGPGVIGTGVAQAVATATDTTPPQEKPTTPPEPPVTPTNPPASDRTPPVLESTSLPNNAVGVPLDQTLSATFNESLGSSRSTATLEELDTSDGIVTGTKSVDGRTITFSPSVPLMTETNYRVTFTVFDRAGNAAQVAQIDFVTETGPASAPTQFMVTATSPTTAEGTWSAPVSGAAPTQGYEFRSKLHTEALWDDNAWQDTTTSLSLSGLSAGQTYDVQLRAKAVAPYPAGATATQSVTTPVFSDGIAPTSIDLSDLYDNRIDPGDEVRLTFDSAPEISSGAQAWVKMIHNGAVYYTPDGNLGNLTVDGNDLVLTTVSQGSYSGTGGPQVRVLGGVTVDGVPVNTSLSDPFALTAGNPKTLAPSPTVTSTTGGVLTGTGEAGHRVDVLSVGGELISFGNVVSGEFSIDLRGRNISVGEPVWIYQYREVDNVPGPAVKVTYTE